MIALIGLLADFVSAIGGLVMVALDALSVLFAFAGGVVRLSFLLRSLPYALSLPFPSLPLRSFQYPLTLRMSTR